MPHHATVLEETELHFAMCLRPTILDLLQDATHLTATYWAGQYGVQLRFFAQDKALPYTLDCTSVYTLGRGYVIAAERSDKTYLPTELVQCTRTALPEKSSAKLPYTEEFLAYVLSEKNAMFVQHLIK